MDSQPQRHHLRQRLPQPRGLGHALWLDHHRRPGRSSGGYEHPLARQGRRLLNITGNNFWDGGPGHDLGVANPWLAAQIQQNNQVGTVEPPLNPPTLGVGDPSLPPISTNAATDKPNTESARTYPRAQEEDPYSSACITQGTQA